MADISTKLVLELIDKATGPLRRVEESLKDLTNIQKSIIDSTNKEVVATKKSAEALTADAKASIKDTKAKKEQNKSIKELGNSLIELGAGLEIKSKLTEILEVGKEFQSMRFRLSAVLGVDMANKDLDSYIKKFQKLATKGLGSYEEVSNTGYALFSAGLDKNQAIEGTEVALKVAKITNGNAEDVANIMATASKDFRVSMSRVGDVFTKAQIKFQIKDFQQLEEGLKYVAATASSVKMPIEQATTVLGALNNAGKNGSMAGTGFNEIINYMSKVDKKLKITVPRMKDGSMDFIKWSELVAKKIKQQAGSSLDAQHALENKLFGIQGGSAFAVIMNYMKEMPGYLDDIKNHSKGVVETNIAKYYQTFAAKTIALHSAAENLYNAIATSIIPMFTSLLGVIVPVISAITNLISNHKDLGGAIFLAAGALASFMAITGGYKLIIAPLLGTLKPLVGLFRLLRLNILWNSLASLIWKTTMLSLTGVIKAVRLATILFNVALWSNPLVLIIGGIIAVIGALAFAVYEVIKHWSKVKKFFSTLWDFIKLGFNKVVSFIKDLWQGIGKVFEKVASWFGIGNKKLEIKATKDQNNNINIETTNKTEDKNIKPITKQTDNSYSASSGSNTTYNSTYKPPIASNSSSTNNIVYHNTFNVSGNNLNHQELASHITKILKDQHKTVMAN